MILQNPLIAWPLPISIVWSELPPDLHAFLPNVFKTDRRANDQYMEKVVYTSIVFLLRHFTPKNKNCEC